MQQGSPPELSALGRYSKLVRKGKWDSEQARNSTAYDRLVYNTPTFHPSTSSAHGTGNTDVDVSDLVANIRVACRKGWEGKALQLVGEFCHDLIYYIRSRGKVILKIQQRAKTGTAVPGPLELPIEKRGRETITNFQEFLVRCGFTSNPEVMKLMAICNQTPLVADKIHLRTLLTIFADTPSLLLDATPVHIHKLLGSGGQRSIFQTKTRGGDRYALRPDTREKELERMFTCLQALDATYLCHIYEAPDYDEQRVVGGRCHLFMPVMAELDAYFDAGRLKDEPENVLRMVQHVAMQLKAMADDRTVHRDVKPANILVFFDESSPQHETPCLTGKPFFFLTDFGWSCEVGAESGNSVGGTKQYRDPFIFVYPPHPKHDLWCLGMAMLFLINRVTESSSKASIVRRVKHWQDRVLTDYMALDKNAGEKFNERDFRKWRGEWQKMVLDEHIMDMRRFRVGNQTVTECFVDLLRGCLDLRWESRWTADTVLRWVNRTAENHNFKSVLLAETYATAHAQARGLSL